MSGRPSALVGAVLAIALAGCDPLGTGSPPPSVGPSVAPPITPAPTPARVVDGEPWIVYQGGAEAPTLLRLVRPDGSNDRALIRDPMPDGAQAHPAWSPDGSTVAFALYVTQETGPDRVDLWTVGADGSGPRELARCELPCLQLASPAWSPDGSRLAFVRYEIREDLSWGRSTIEVLEVASGARRAVWATDDGTTAAYTLRWSPDGRALAFTLETYPDEAQLAVLRSSIAVVAVEGSGAGRVTVRTPRDLFAAQPDWAPGDRILFAIADSMLDWPATSTIGVMNADGAQRTAVTTIDDGPGSEPTWTADGRVMYVAADLVAGQRLAFVDPDAGGPEIASWALATPPGAQFRAHPHLRPTP